MKDIIARVQVDAGPMLQQLEAVAARMEAAAAAMGPPIEGQLMTLESSSGSSIGPIATVLVAGAALAGSTRHRVTRRALLGLDWIRGRRLEA